MGILLIEDNITISKGLQYFFEKSGFNMDISNTISNAIEKIENKKYDLIILDIALPDGNGCEFYKNYIKKTEIPTIFLTANDTEDDIVKGFDLGADDYITKPFSSRELLARAKRILMKNKKNIICVRNIKFDFEKMEVYKDENKIDFTSLELKILSLLFSNINKVVSRAYILECIWNWTGNDVYDNTVTVYMKRIRAKIGEDIIITVKGVGYRIDEK